MSGVNNNLTVDKNIPTWNKMKAYEDLTKHTVMCDFWDKMKAYKDLTKHTVMCDTWDEIKACIVSCIVLYHAGVSKANLLVFHVICSIIELHVYALTQFKNSESYLLIVFKIRFILLGPCPVLFADI